MNEKPVYDTYFGENLFKSKKRLQLGVCIEKYCLFLSDRK